MLPAQNRLAKKKDFESVFRKGKNYRQGYFVLKVLRKKRPKTRIGFVISKKVAKKASQRNKLKRILSEAARMRTVKMKKGIDMVLIILKAGEKTDRRQLEQDLDKIFQKSGVYEFHQ